MNPLFLLFIILIHSCVIARYTRGSSGTYRYVNRQSGKTHYVGATNNFRRRNREHQRAGHYYANPSKYKLVKNNMGRSSQEKRYQKEKEDIKYYQPIANKYRGGNGRRESL